MKLSDLTKEQLIDEVKKLRSRKKYGLVWEDKLEDVVVRCKKQLPVLDEVEDKAIVSDNDLPTNLIIEGDNYHALSVLNYTHRGKIDVVYIDPPYNTGNNDFRYNDNYVDKDDSYRHSKWLSFMNKRLELAKNLLKDSGVIFISIDDNEIAQIKLLCDEKFGETNLVGMVSVAKGTTTGQDAKKFGSSVDYLLVYGMTNYIPGRIELSEKDKKRFSKRDERGLYSTLQFRKTGNNDRRENRPNLYYSLIAPDKSEIFPIGPTGYESTWRGDLKFYNKLLKTNMIEWVKQDGVWKPYVKYYLEGRVKAPSNLWIDIEGNKKATIELKEIFGDKVFQNPKPTDLIKRCVSLSNTPNPVVLDFFAGSGTTGQAILKMNQTDGGTRKFILCTNNENNIAEEITYPRIKKVIEGYSNLDGISANLRYFKTSFVSKSNVSDDTRNSLVKKSVEMICVRENTFEKVIDNRDFKIFKSGEQTTGIIFNFDEIETFKKELEKQKMTSHIYVFSLTSDTYRSDFEDLEVEHELCPIPESILEVYRKLFRE